MSKPKCLDLFCCAGGASKGYSDAGFEVTGVDVVYHPNYPFRFILANALEYLQNHWREYDFIALSPPCQFGTGIQHLGKARNGSYPVHLNLIPQSQELVLQTGKPYVIENVQGARKYLINPVMLCGTYFGLKVYRHRYFESNLPLTTPNHHPHKDSTPSAGNGKSPKGFISVCGTGGVRGMTNREVLDYWKFAMGIGWMSRAELAEAIPPAYTEFIGRQIIELI